MSDEIIEPELVTDDAPLQIREDISDEKVTPFTVEEVQRHLPRGFHGEVTQKCCDILNSLDQDPVMAKEMRERFISYSNLLTTGKYKLHDYIYAVKYVSLKLIGYTDKDSYRKTFPDRYTKMVDAGYDDKRISAHIAMYAKGKLIVELMSQVQIPVWVLNQDKMQLAINTLVDICLHDKSGRNRVNAAVGLAELVKRPEAAVPGLQINQQFNFGASAEQVMEDIAAMTESYKKALDAGVPLNQLMSVKPHSEEDEYA